MKNLISHSASAQMTSLEIAGLVEKRHDNIKRTIETLANKGIIRLPQFEDSEKINNLGLPQKTKYYLFSGEQGKRDSIVVVAQLSPEFTARLVDRWMELEAQLVNPINTIPKPLAVLEQYAELALNAYLNMYQRLSIPLPKAHEKAVEAVKVKYHIDLSNVLQYSLALPTQPLPPPKTKTVTRETTFHHDTWDELIANWVVGRYEFTMLELLSECLNLEPNDITRAAQTRAGNALHRLGWKSSREMRNGTRVHVYRKVAA